MTDFNEILNKVEVPKLSEEKAEMIEGPLILELTQAKMKQDKSPGPDGFTPPFYLFVLFVCLFIYCGLQQNSST